MQNLTNTDILKFQFQDIPQEYYLLMNRIKDTTLQKVYNNISFLYVDYSSISSADSNQEQTIISNYLFDCLNQFLFFTYYFTHFNNNNILISTKSKDENLSTNINTVICVENKCFIIKSINKNTFFNVIQSLKVAKINCNQISEESIEIRDEINNLSKHFIRKEKKNNFVQFTIRPISCYLVRRFYYPSYFFKDPSFFIFDKEKESSELIFKSKLNEYIKGKNLTEIEYNYFMSSIEKVIQNDEVNMDEQFTDYNECDFVELRNIKTYIVLVFHLKSLYPFILKKLNYQVDEGSINREINFCCKNRNRCFLKCYGFVKIYGRIERIIYHFMCNDTLSEKVSEMNEFYLTQTLARLFEGMNYLHSNSKVHRDLKPSNILLDHDLNAYISDFETIRAIEDGSDNNGFTYDFGTNEFTSPEQMQGRPISFSTDVYSFGKIIEYIIKKNQKCYYFKETIEYLSNLAGKCTRYEPKERASLEQIKDYLASFFEFFFDHKLSFFNMLFNNFRQFENFQFFYENLAFSLKYRNNEKIKIIFNNYLYSCKYNHNVDIELHSGILYNMGVECLKSNNLSKAEEFFELAIENNCSTVIWNIANLYLTGQGVEKDFLKAKYYLEKAAANGNVQALNSLGYLYYYGNGVKQDYFEAKKYYEKAIKQNDCLAFYYLGNLYYRGLGVEQDFVKAKELFEFAAQQNNSEALNCLGNIYYFGKGTKIDYDKAKHYYELSAQQNNTNAFFNLGKLYYDGMAVEKNIMKAIEYYQIAAQQNHSKAMINLGLIFLHNQNFGKAKEYFEMAVKLDNSEGLNNLGNLYYHGQGVEKDHQKAKEYYEKALKMNSFEAYNCLGILYLYGYGVKLDYAKAKEYFEIAAEHKQANGLANLGMIYLNGFGVQKDLNKAVEYLEKAASFNNSDALNWLGYLYFNGIGIPQNFSKAKEYFELAIKQNNIDALANLGLLYLKGRGVDKDINKAKKYFELGASKNNSEALNCLGNFYLSEEEGVQDFVQARKYFELAIKHDNSNAITNLGLLYLNGRGVEIDLNKARELFEKAASLSNSTAILMLGNIYLEGIGVEQNSSKAIQCFKDAISLNDYKGYSSLGKMYYNGNQGVERDVLRSKDYFEMAAKHNDAESLFYLFLIYAGGEGNVKVDPVKAEQYVERYLTSPEDFTKSSALCIIGMFYFEGSCFKKDYNKAKIFFELSSERKFSYATFYLALIYWKGLGLERNYSKAKEYFELAIDQGNLDSFFYLGYIYENGKGVEIDLNKAIEFYSKCAENQIGSGLSPDNKNYYRSNNDIGLIYLLEKEVQNLELAEKYLKMAGLNEYQLGQNNLALFLLNFSNLKYDSEYFLLKASKKQFALSEFNL